MWFQYKGIQHALHADDIAGIVFIYGESDFEPDLVASFASGTWWHDHPTRWDRQSVSTARALTYIRMLGYNSHVFSFNSGTWYIDDTGQWKRISTSTARALCGDSRGWLLASFPSGTWLYDAWGIVDPPWIRISTSTAHALAWVDTTGNGYVDSAIFSFDSGTWLLSNPFSVVSASASESVASRIPDGANTAGALDWYRITPSRARAISSSPYGPFAWMSFPSGTWLYYIPTGIWDFRLTTSTAHAITYAEIPGSNLNPVFSFNSGTWYLNAWGVLLLQNIVM